MDSGGEDLADDFFSSLCQGASTGLWNVCQKAKQVSCLHTEDIMDSFLFYNVNVMLAELKQACCSWLATRFAI